MSYRQTSVSRLNHPSPENIIFESTGGLLIVPHHFDMFTFNTVDVREFERKADAVNHAYRVLHCGERFIWSK
jgi:hypothetical protein